MNWKEEYVSIKKGICKIKGKVKVLLISKESCAPEVNTYELKRRIL